MDVDALILDVDMNNLRATIGKRMDFFEESFNTPAARLGFLMSDKGVKQKDLAALLGVSGPYVSTVVSGLKDLTPENWLRVAEYFGVTLDWLLCRREAPMYWPADTGDEVPVGISKQAEEAARIIDAVPPRKRDEMLSVLRAMSFSVQVMEQDANEVTRRLVDSLAFSGKVLTPEVVERIRAVLFAFGLGLGPNDERG